MPGAFVPGLFSQAGRSTAFEIESLQNQLHLTDDKSPAHGPGDPDNGEKQSKSSKSKAHSKGSGAAKSQEDLKPRTAGGELAKAIQEKLGKKDADSQQKSPRAAECPIVRAPSPTAAMGGEGKDGLWATKFTASNDIGALNRRNEQRPDPVWYQVKHESVLYRPPAWDYNLRPKHSPRSKPEKHSSSPMAFMTGLDLDDKDAIQALTARQRTMLKEVMGTLPEKPKLAGSMSLNSERGPLGKIGRNHINGHEVSCAYDSDLLEQDIKGYWKLRYPKWDMDAPLPRQPLIKDDALGEPGKYDVNLDAVKPRNQAIGIGFGKALPRSVCVSTMGYSAPPAVLHPEEKRTRGQLPDRSKSKNAVRHRVTHVNDFDREMARPPLLTGAATVYHDENDPAVVEAVHKRETTYDATTADIAVTRRRDICPKYQRMLGRGKEAVQGIRALSQDLAVRGSVGLGFFETMNDKERTVEQRESRAMDGSKENPNIGPRFDYRTVNLHNAQTEKTLRGRPHVKGTGLGEKKGPLKQTNHPILANAFKRSASLPGFDARSKYGGTRILPRNRSSSAIPGWAPAELDGQAG